MTEIILGDGQSYLLPLDSLDVTYLSKYVRSSNDKLSPIWSQQRLNGESEYFHVKIAAQRIDEEDCYLESLDTYTCHICDINVPKICYNQHNESKQHETCKKICEKILERVAKQININNIDNDWDDTKNLYYCAPCSRAVNLKNKHQHESSDYHKNSEENMSIINDFYNKILENGTQINLPREHSHHDSNSDSDESETQDIKRDIDSNNLKRIPNIVNNLQNDFDSDDEYLSITDKNNEVFAKIQELQIASQLTTAELCNGSTSEQHQPFDSYLKEMISKYNLNVSTPVTDGEYIIIGSPNGDKVKVFREHFHSYRHINKRVYCQVCKMWISQDTRPHEVTEIHVRNIFKSINDKYARVIDTVYSHCLICNEVILAESDHQNISDDHKNHLVVAKIQQNTKNIDHKISKIYIDTHSLNPNEHNIKTEADLLEINNIFKINCSKCFGYGNCQVNLDSNALNNHINNMTHTDKMSVPNVVTKAEYCETCKVEVPQGEMKAHNASESHKDAIIKVFWGCVKNSFTAFIEELKIELQKCDTPRNKTAPTNTQCCQNQISVANTAQNESLTSQIKTPLSNTAQNKSLISENKLSQTDNTQNESLMSPNKTTPTNTIQNESLISKNKQSLTSTVKSKSFTSLNKTTQTSTKQNERFISQNQSAQTNAAHDKSFNPQNQSTQPNAAPNESLISEYKPSLTNTAQNKTLTTQNNQSAETNTTHDESLNPQNQSTQPNAAPNESLISEYKPSLTNTAQNKTLTSQNHQSAEANTTHDESLNHQNQSTQPNAAPNESLISEYKPSLTNTAQNKTLTSQNNQSAETNTTHDESLNPQNQSTQPNAAPNESLISEYKPSLNNTAQNKTITSQNNQSAVTNTVHDKSLNSQNKTALLNTAQNIKLTSNISSTSTTNNNSRNNKIYIYKRQIIIDGDITLLVYTDDTKRTVKCESCNVKIPSNENNFIQHLLGYNHSQIFKKYTKLLAWNDETETAVKCRICDVCMPNLQRNVYEHMKGEPHKEQLNATLAYHQILKDGNIYKCRCCEVYLFDYFNHINSDNHTNKLQLRYKIDNKLVRKYVYEHTFTHNGEAIQFRELYKNLLRSNNITKLNNSKFFCGICLVELSRISEIDHVLSESHKSAKKIT